MEEKQCNFCLGVPENTEGKNLTSLRGTDIKKPGYFSNCLPTT